MKVKHYVNIGYPRCGTTWLWNNLVAHPEIFKAASMSINDIMNTRTFVALNKEPKHFYKRSDHNEYEMELIEEVYENKKKFSERALQYAEKHDWSNICKQVAQVYEQFS